MTIKLNSIDKEEAKKFLEATFGTELLDIHGVSEFLDMSRSSVNTLISRKESNFPKPIYKSKKENYKGKSRNPFRLWWVEDIENWLDSRPITINDSTSYVYFIQSGEYIKIGKSRHPQRRYGQLIKEDDTTKRPKDVDLLDAKLLGVFIGGLVEEGMLHKKLESYRISGTEWFKATEQVLDVISICVKLHDTLLSTIK